METEVAICPRHDRQLLSRPRRCRNHSFAIQENFCSLSEKSVLRRERSDVLTVPCHSSLLIHWFVGFAKWLGVILKWTDRGRRLAHGRVVTSAPFPTPTNHVFFSFLGVSAIEAYPFIMGADIYQEPGRVQLCTYFFQHRLLIAPSEAPR